MSSPPDRQDPPFWRIAVTGPHRALPAIEAVFEPLGTALSIFEVTANGALEPGPDTLFQVEALTLERPDRAAIEKAFATVADEQGLAAPSLTIEPVPRIDWLAEVEKGFEPVRAGRFGIHGSHAARPPGVRLAIRIDAGLAFGTGHHESTTGCLLALDRLGRGMRPRACLDMGSGSGVLAIACAKLWRAPTLAVDIDPLAVATGAANGRANGVAPLIRSLDGGRVRQTHRGGGGPVRRDLRQHPGPALAANGSAPRPAPSIRRPGDPLRPAGSPGSGRARGLSGERAHAGLPHPAGRVEHFDRLLEQNPMRWNHLDFPNPRWPHRC